MTISEVDFDLAYGESGVKIYNGQDAINERIKNWAERFKKGEIWGDLEKGSILHHFQFLSPSDRVLTALKMYITDDLERQVPLKVMRISCTPPKDKDKRFRIQLFYIFEETEGQYDGEH
jgi:hypothetical protein